MARSHRQPPRGVRQHAAELAGRQRGAPDCQLLLSLSLRLFGHVGAAVGGLTLILLTGSAAGLRLVYADWQHSGRSLPEFQFQLYDQFASNADVALAGWVRANTAPDDVFIATPCRRRTRG